MLVGELVARRIGLESDVVLFWGSLDLPTVLLSPVSLIDHLDAIVDVGPVFWVFGPEPRVLIECRPSGLITVVTVPTGRISTDEKRPGGPPGDDNGSRAGATLGPC